MDQFRLWAEPWWVNLLILIPPVTFWGFRRQRIELAVPRLIALAIFALAFSFVEAAVVVYLRAASGLLPGYYGSLAEVQRAAVPYSQSVSVLNFPQSLLTIEVCREAATMVMLVAVAWLAGANSRNRWAAFLWTFSLWDAAYYASLWATVRWPTSLRDSDVLFLIPVPWFAQVWFPLLVSALTVLAILLCQRPVSAGSERFQ